MLLISCCTDLSTVSHHLMWGVRREDKCLAVPGPRAQLTITRSRHVSSQQLQEGEEGLVCLPVNRDHLVFAESPVTPGVPVVYRPPEERAANPDRLNLDRRHLSVCPVLEVTAQSMLYSLILLLLRVQGEEQLRLLNLQHNAISRIQHLSHLHRLVFLDLYDNLLQEINGLENLSSLRVLMLGRNRSQPPPPHTTHPHTPTSHTHTHTHTHTH